MSSNYHSTEDMKETGVCTVVVIAGEPSGDLLGAPLIDSIREKVPSAQFVGVGGPAMIHKGLKSIFPMDELSVMGILEVLPRIARILRRIRETVEFIKTTRPDVVVTIDSPDFSFRVVKKLGNCEFPLVHYVAPTVWAWRPKRAKKIAQYYDHLLALLPFEPPYFQDVGLPCTFVGHPVVLKPFTGNGSTFRKAHGIDSDTEVVGVLPGSRKGEVARHLPIFLAAMELCVQITGKSCHVVIPTVQGTDLVVRNMVKHCSMDITVVDQDSDKDDAFASFDAALAASGTVALELAKASVPAVIGYKVSAITAAVARRLIRVRYVSLVNILEDREVTPELLQEQCTASELATRIAVVLQDSDVQARQVSGYQSALAQLRVKECDVDSLAAKEIVSLINTR